MPRLLLVYLKGFLILPLFFVVAFLYSSEVSAAELWSDDFSSVDIGRWTVLNETNTPVIFGSEALFANISSDKSLFFQNNLPLPSGDISVEIKFRYLNSSYNFGNGIAVNDNPVSLRSGIHPGGSDWTTFVWPTGGASFKVFSSICPSSGPCVADNVYSTISAATFASPHVLKIDYIGSKYLMYLDGSFIGDTVITPRAPRYIWLGNPMVTGGVNFASFYVDYVKVSDFSSDPPTPTFSYLSQKDPQWASELYDSANVWAPLGQDGIDRWGCAITSVAMILREYGVKAHDGSDVDPSKLNAWLKTQPDGYIGPGLLNWMAVTRYAKVSYEAGHADTKLEYSRSYEPSSATLPTILGVPGHFVVAHDEDVTNWIINDPANQAITTLPKTSTLRSINTFAPSLTDLSYILLTKTPGSTVTMTDALGNPVALEWVEEYLDDDVGGTPSPTLLTAMLPKPSSGEYAIEVVSPSDDPTTLGVYLYDDEAVVNQTSWEVPASTTKTIALTYDNTDSAGSQATEVVADTTAPEIPTLLSPTHNSATNSATIILDWSEVSDPSSPVTYDLRYKKGNGSYIAQTTGTNSIYSNNLAEGVYSWQVRACDSAGNCSPWSNSWKVTVDRTKPAAPKIQYALSWWHHVFVEWREVRDADRYKVVWGTKKTMLNNEMYVNRSEAWLPKLDHGKYYIGVYAIDKAGNMSALSRIEDVVTYKHWHHKHWWY